ncbi:MAG: hypothetical protein WBP81_05035 [Solirubrobacteraceae bacterium]
MSGVTIFIVFAVGVALTAVTRSWPIRRLLVTGVALDVVGLALVVVAAWLPAPSLVLFLAGDGVVGGGAAALFKGTLGSIVEISPPDKLGETLAGFFLSGYVGLSVPAIAVGIALQTVSARDTLLAFAIAVSAGIFYPFNDDGADQPSRDRRAQKMDSGSHPRRRDRSPAATSCSGR